MLLSTGSSAVVSVTVWPLSEGSNWILSPSLAIASAWRRDPTPLSLTLVTIKGPAAVPLSRNAWSGAAASPKARHALLTPQVPQRPEPPFGFCQAAGELACTVRLVHHQSPF